MKIDQIWTSAGHGDSSKTPEVYDPGAVHKEGSVFWEEAAFTEYLASGLVLLDPEHYMRVYPAPIAARVKFVNEVSFKDDIFLELHMNSAWGATGVEVIYSELAPERRRDEAGILSHSVASVLGLRDRGPKLDSDTPAGAGSSSGTRRGIAVVRDTRIPAFLLEVGFMQSAQDREAAVKSGVEAIHEGIKSLREAG